jgi:hypothetical protein
MTNYKSQKQLTKIFLNVSDISTFIGIKKYNIVDIFERLWKKIDNDYQICLMNLEKSIIKKEILNKNITDVESYAKKTVKELSETNDEKIKKVFGEEIVEILKNKTCISNKKELIDKKIENNESIKNLQNISEIKNIATNIINTTHGIKEEPITLNIIQTKFNTNLNTEQKYKYKKLKYDSIDNYEWFIGGRMDAIDNETRTIIEIKNRVNKLFSRILDYELCQIQLYMWLVDFSNSKLIENYNQSILEYEIAYDPLYIDNVLNKINIFINNFEINFINNLEIKIKYLQLNINEKENFILQNIFIN